MKLAITAIAVLAVAGCAIVPVNRTGMAERAPRAGGDVVVLCHKGKTMQLPRSAMQGHLNHGDRLGRC